MRVVGKEPLVAIQRRSPVTVTVPAFHVWATKKPQTEKAAAVPGRRIMKRLAGVARKFRTPYGPRTAR